MLRKCASITPRLHFPLLPWSRRLNTQPNVFSFASPKPSPMKKVSAEAVPDGMNDHFVCDISWCPVNCYNNLSEEVSEIGKESQGNFLMMTLLLFLMNALAKILMTKEKKGKSHPNHLD